MSQIMIFHTKINKIMCSYFKLETQNDAPKKQWVKCCVYLDSKLEKSYEYFWIIIFDDKLEIGNKYEMFFLENYNLQGFKKITKAEFKLAEQEYYLENPEDPSDLPF